MSLSFVAADLGASGTRCVSDNGKIGFLPNNMVKIHLDEVTDLEANSNEIENNLEFTIRKEGESNIFPVTCLYGSMAERLSSNQVRPSGLSHKHKQEINYISSILAIAVQKIKMGLSDDILYVFAVPPVEVKRAEVAFREELVGKYTVIFPKYLGGTTVTFNIVDVRAFAESAMAAASFFFNMTGVPKEENKSFLSGQVLSLDIGASTSDLALVKNGKFPGMSGKTIKFGGNISRTELINLVREEYGFELPIPDAERTMAEGRLQSGNGYVEVREFVEDAKRKLAKSLTESIDTYFQEINVPISMIRGIIVSGGGSMVGKYINADGEEVRTSEPLSYFVTDEIKKLCKTVEVLEYGEDARLANVKGLFIRAKLIMTQMAAEASKVSAQNTVNTVANATVDNNTAQVNTNQAVANNAQTVAPQATTANFAQSQPVTPVAPQI